MPDRFLQIHTLTSYAGTLLNRDDMGFAKRLPFGGVERTRISSQCLKRHWRTFQGQGALSELGESKAVRSRRTFADKVLSELVKSGIDQEIAEKAVTMVVETAVGKQKKNAPGQTEQVTVLGEKEVAHLETVARQIAGDLKEGRKEADIKKERLLSSEAKANLQALIRGAGLDAALFGRMVTSDVLSRVDAAIHVAHAITVHKAQTHDDYFSAVDDLAKDHGESGSGHINSTQLTSGLFYGYVVVDVPLLVSNLSMGETTAADGQALAGKVIERLIRLVSTVSPGAKLGATAPYASASLLLVEGGDAQPRTLANAFLRPVSLREAEAESAERIRAYLQDYDAMYEPGLARAVAGLGLPDTYREAVGAAPDVRSLAQISAWAAQRVTA